MTGPATRFDADAAWALLSPEEQAEIGALALSATVCVLADFPGLDGLEAWRHVQPGELLEEIETALDTVIQAALQRVGAIAANTAPPPPVDIEEVP